MTSRKLSSLLLVPACCLAVSQSAKARSSVPIVNLEKQTWLRPDGKQLTKEQVKVCIIKAGMKIGYPWSAQEEADGSLTLSTLVRNKHHVKVRVTYTTSEFSIFYKDSLNMNFVPSGDSGLIHPNYNKWVVELADHIKMEVLTMPIAAAQPTPAPDAAPATDSAPKEEPKK